MITKKDLSFKSYIWTQLPDNLIRSKIIRKSVKSKSMNQPKEIDSDHPSGDENDEVDDITDVTTFEQVLELLVDAIPCSSMQFRAVPCSRDLRLENR